MPDVPARVRVGIGGSGLDGLAGSSHRLWLIPEAIAETMRRFVHPLTHILSARARRSGRVVLSVVSDGAACG